MLVCMHVVFNNLPMHFFVKDRACEVNYWSNHLHSFWLYSKLSPADSNSVLELV